MNDTDNCIFKKMTYFNKGIGHLWSNVNTFLEAFKCHGFIIAFIKDTSLLEVILTTTTKKKEREIRLKDIGY